MLALNSYKQWQLEETANKFRIEVETNIYRAILQNSTFDICNNPIAITTTRQLPLIRSTRLGTREDSMIVPNPLNLSQ